MVKINADELAGLGSGPDVLGGATALQAAGAEAVVVSEGKRGLLAVTPEGRWRAAPPQKLLGNPTGAGDAVSAALLEGALHGRSWPERLSDAVALSAAAVRAPLAGSFDDDVYRSLRGVPVTDLGR
jgi:tagatose 6-phosphate kinase